MDFKITSHSITLKTKDKYITEDINISIYKKILDAGSLQILIDTRNSCDYLCANSTAVNLDFIGLLDTSNVTNMKDMFYNCYYLTSIPQLNTNKVIYMYGMFYNCYKLEKIDLTHFNVENSTSGNIQIFYNCYSLKQVIIRSFGVNYAIGTNVFRNCYHILGTVDATYNPNGLKDGYIYVPRNMIETLSNATNWSAYADQIRALEDYTVDGTTTGELDESKI